jgi:hypothetical protein
VRSASAARRDPLGWAVAGLGVVCLAGATALWAVGFGTAADAVPMAQPAAHHSGPAVVAPVAPGPEASGPINPAFMPSVGATPVAIQLPGAASVPIRPVGTAGSTGMELPDDPKQAGWWIGGSAPGDASGTTVLVGHLDSLTGGLGAFAALLDIPSGARLTVTDSAGAPHAYRVSSRQQLAKSDLPASLFTREGAPRLVLVTCGGAFDQVTHHYADNVIVTAAPADG